VGEIATASHEQSQGISQVSLAVGRMDKATQGNAATAEECASASSELNLQSQSLKAAVARLQEIVRTRAGAAAPLPDHAPVPVESAAFFAAASTATPLPETIVPAPVVTPVLGSATPDR